MKQRFVQATMPLLILAFLAAALLITVPVEDADAWKLHVCEVEIKTKDNEGNFTISLRVEYYSHDHWGFWYCDFECP